MNCDIIQDLLPLYHDGVCSAASQAAVEELAGKIVSGEIIVDSTR